LIVQPRFNNRLENSSSVGIHSMGSKPRFDIGGSAIGDAQRRIRPSRLASMKANWAAGKASVAGKCIINCGGDSGGRKGQFRYSPPYLHEPRRPTCLTIFRFPTIVQWFLSLNLWSRRSIGARSWAWLLTCIAPVIPRCNTGCLGPSRVR